MNKKVNDSVLEITEAVSVVLNAISLDEMVGKIDTRVYQPFGPNWDYSKEKPIVVSHLFAYDRFFEYAFSEGEKNVFRLNNWLAIVDHYGFHHDYDRKFLGIFFPYVSKALLKIYTDDDNAIDIGLGRYITPRFFNGEPYTRSDFIDKFLNFFEVKGFEF